MAGSSKSPKIDPLDLLTRTLRGQPKLVLVSFASAGLGALLSVHDYHHPQTHFGYSTPFLGVAILLYLLGRRTR